MSLSREKNRELDRIFADPARAKASTRTRLFVGGREYTARVKALKDSASPDGPAVLLEAVVSGGVPLSIRDESVRLEAEIGGVRLGDVYRGRLVRPAPGVIESALAANTGGYWLGELSFEEETSFLGARPDTVLRSVLRRCPYGRVLGPQVESPAFTRSDDSEDSTFSYDALDKLSDATEAVEDEADLRVWDLPENVGSWTPEKSLESPGEVVAEWEVGRHIRRDKEADGFRYAGNFEAGHSHVVVWRQSTEGGPREILQKVPIRGSKAPAGAWLDVQVSDQTPEAYEDAYRRAYRIASRESRGSGGWALEALETVMLDPRVKRGSTVAVTEAVKEASVSGGPGAGPLVRRRFLVVVEAVDRDWYARTGSYPAGTLTVAREEVLEVPPPLQRGPRDVARRMFGAAPNGQAYFGLPLSFAYFDGEAGELVFDLEGAREAGVSITQEGEVPSMETVIRFG